jgi:hypothetical protein
VLRAHVVHDIHASHVIVLNGRVVLGVFDKINLELLQGEDLRIIVIYANVYSFVLSLWRSDQRYLFRDLGQRNLLVGLTNYH